MFWIGGYRKDGKWWWQGEDADLPMITTDWAKGQPDFAVGVQDCVSVFADGGDAATQWFRFDNDGCTAKRRFICERKY